MNVNHKETEVLILDAARKVFLENGFDGTSMQMIATEAGINKALLHYYYRSKDRLFEAVFIEAFGQMAPNLVKVFMSDMPFEEMIRAFVDAYISALLKFPQIPQFILHELHRNPQRIVELIKSTGINPELVFGKILREMELGNIRSMDPRQLMVNMLALCIFPFAARPMIQGFIFRNDSVAFDRFLEERKVAVADFILNAVKP
jgi:TetR/AcrR family transcriptional regulator